MRKDRMDGWMDGCSFEGGSFAQLFGNVTPAQWTRVVFLWWCRGGSGRGGCDGTVEKMTTLLMR